MIKKEENKEIIQINLDDCLNASSIMDPFLEVTGFFWNMKKNYMRLLSFLAP